jgi:hypothetical protein
VLPRNKIHPQTPVAPTTAQACAQEAILHTLTSCLAVSNHLKHPNAALPHCRAGSPPSTPLSRSCSVGDVALGVPPVHVRGHGPSRSQGTHRGPPRVGSAVQQVVLRIVAGGVVDAVHVLQVEGLVARGHQG